MKLIYTVETEEEFSEIEGIHNIFDMVLMREDINIKKSVLQTEGEVAEITEHDSEKKCRICGCNWFNACPGGCYWVEDDLCSKCTEFDLRKITYKGITHLYNYAYQTDCGITVPFQGKHLASKSVVTDMANITCKKCLDTIATIH